LARAYTKFTSPICAALMFAIGEELAILPSVAAIIGPYIGLVI